jgi:hypothetical protein
MSPNEGGRGGGVGGSQPLSTAVHTGARPTKLWRSNSICNLFLQPYPVSFHRRAVPQTQRDERLRDERKTRWPLRGDEETFGSLRVYHLGRESTGESSVSQNICLNKDGDKSRL